MSVILEHCARAASARLRDLFPIAGSSRILNHLYSSASQPSNDLQDQKNAKVSLCEPKQKGSYLQDDNGRSRIRSGMASLRTVDFYPSDQNFTLQLIYQRVVWVVVDDRDGEVKVDDRDGEVKVDDRDGEVKVG